MLSQQGGGVAEVRLNVARTANPGVGQRQAWKVLWERLLKVCAEEKTASRLGKPTVEGKPRGGDVNIAASPPANLGNGGTRI